MEPLHEMRRSDGPSLFFLAVVILVIGGHAAGISPVSLSLWSLMFLLIGYLWFSEHRRVYARITNEGASLADDGDGESGSEPTEPPTEEFHPPAPFKRRLAHFLHCDEDELTPVQKRSKSTMAFWTARPLGPRHGPKAISHIRMLLERIHRLIHSAILTEKNDKFHRQR